MRLDQADRIMLGDREVSRVYLGATLVWERTFLPASLFAQGEPGVWYDPSDFSTMFQDAAGTMPVTAVEQPVGLMLDKSKNLDIAGDYYRTDFSSSSGWVLGAGHTIADGKFKLASALNGSQSYGALGGAKGYKKVTVVVDSVASGGFFVVLNNAGAVSPLINSAGTYVYFLADYAGTSRAGITASGASTTATISSLVIEVVSGHHARQPTATARPIYRASPARIDFDTVDDALITTFPASLGSNCTIARAIPGVGAQILAGQTVGTTFSDSTDHAGLVIINRALTPSETTALTAYLTEKVAA